MRYEWDKELIKCPGCGDKVARDKFFMGLCPECTAKGYWMDPVGGVHRQDNAIYDDYDPAAMYE